MIFVKTFEEAMELSEELLERWVHMPTEDVSRISLFAETKEYARQLALLGRTIQNRWQRRCMYTKLAFWAANIRLETGELYHAPRLELFISASQPSI